MSVYAKIVFNNHTEKYELIPARNGYNGIIGLADNPEICIENGFTEYTEEQISGYFAGTQVINDAHDGLKDITTTPEYINAKVESTSIDVYKYIIDKYDQILKYGVFKISEDSYANMAWYDTWSKAVSLYESSGESLSTTFTVRLYKKNSNGAYYNIDTVQNLTGLKALLLTLNKQQFVLYQPIKNNLLAQLLYYKSLKNIEKLQELKQLADTDFGDSINELETIDYNI